LTLIFNQDFLENRKDKYCWNVIMASISAAIVNDPTILSLVDAAVPIGNQITSLQTMITQAQNDITVWQATLATLTAQYASLQNQTAARLLELGVPS
jgi:hypothetical protein